ncbi:MAG: alpha/beta fold hydrolase [Oxalicibacterium faecigallinarum]|uniref:alpha/beta fold hydrolase n=1 Tax=Oxalicibacterium faecigallinarum TaxID=573741 RepID=UPI002808F517|nr:alpha/beta fold hydrolase [Oxalicibacterium faecigallinarum]MDQ7968888.1 alpha/beta fold hydrolase [Oxalicibacterium faecigallinarum]
MSYLMKPNLILLPGLLNDARLWQAQAEKLGAVANVSVADLTRSNTIAELAADVLEQVPAGMFALAGLSMGGYVALEVMRQAPERVMSLALLDTSARPDTPEATENRHKLMELAKTDFPAVSRGLREKLLHPAHLGDVALAELLDDMAVVVGKDGFIRQQQAILARIDSRPSLAAIQCPTMVLCGREDKLTPVEVHEEMAALIPRASLTIIEQCGHLSPIEQPDRVTDAMHLWLQQRTT